MNDMSQAIIPRSDQWNADDFLSGPQTFKITDVQIRGGHEQPVSISVEGSEKVFRPCKSMSRVLVNCWGPDASKYIGRSLTIYTDPTVTWGGMKVGGIRIANMSHIEGPMTMALTATRGNKRPYTVKPLPPETAPTRVAATEPPQPPSPEAVAAIIAKGEIAAGMPTRAAVDALWKSTSRPLREAISSDQWKAWLARVEANAKAGEGNEPGSDG